MTCWIVVVLEVALLAAAMGMTVMKSLWCLEPRGPGRD
jgi:hypothetical protein